MAIQAEELTKSFGSTSAVRELSFTVRPGVVTGFLGPNGAGKSTTMRLLLGLDRPTAGRALIDGEPFAEHPAPMRVAGGLLDSDFFHPWRSPRTHLRALAHTHSIPVGRVDEVLELVGLSDAGRRRAGGFSLGMRQRFGLATALLGDPGTLVLDEPFNGLDPEGIRWLRDLLTGLADEDRTVLVSSHLMAEIAEIAERVIVIGRGALIADASMNEFTNDGRVFRVTASDSAGLARALGQLGGECTPLGNRTLDVSGVERNDIDLVAREQGIDVYEVLTQGHSLEETFMRLTQDAVEYRGATRKG
ncbi:ABC-2 type transport system ATP-binding protein [Nocardiopsis mwathae]|uniref:ABC-2 type transport system ATP-binding protein n=1 Tax=Nocardiopsis mwathae TaxID=1472723 RepID=A0A7X0D7U9_9ACTN|nr:ATP-binding cassette domain-containing protein [Nocardiopsis mwathae]MBB6174725.1 ABC-2 type transport system ATP-binding protein [Nocardiopsis mwathae]